MTSEAGFLYPAAFEYLPGRTIPGDDALVGRNLQLLLHWLKAKPDYRNTGTKSALFSIYKSTKGIRPDNVSFDDRAYLRIRIAENLSED